MSLSILIDTRAEGVEVHAKNTIKKIEEASERFPLDIPPRGVPHHMALFPLVCDDCSVTYWSKDKYGLHIGCKGIVERKTGF